MIWIILISLLILLLLWILLIPVIILICTERNRYMLNLPGIVKLAVVPSGDFFHIRGWIFFIPFRYHPFRERSSRRRKREKDQVTVKPVRKKRAGKPSVGIRMGLDMLRSIRIRKLALDMDTDDFVLNAWLIPVFSAVNTENIQLRANFTGTLSFFLDLRIRLGSMLWNFIRYKIRSIY